MILFNVSSIWFANILLRIFTSVYTLGYYWASLVAQLVKNPPAMRETWVQSQRWEDPLEKGTGYTLQYSVLENATV